MLTRSQLGTAAFIGIVVGLVLKFASNVIVAFVGLFAGQGGTPPAAALTLRRRESLDGGSALQDDWSWLGSFDERDVKPNYNFRSRKLATGLLKETIPEESMSE